MLEGWEAILQKWKSEIQPGKHTLVFDCYTGVHANEIKNALATLSPFLFICTDDLFQSEETIRQMTSRYMTEDVLFGYISPLAMEEYFDNAKLEAARTQISSTDGLTILFGHGASMVAHEYDKLIYADMARWEIQQRFRRREVKALGVDNREEAVSLQYKRGYFNDWKVCDSYKKKIYHQVDYWVDTHIPNQPKMIDRETFHQGIELTSTTPFRVVPFFDPAPWGGQWMKSVCDLNPDKANYGWCFDCVPEENSLLLNVNGTLFEMPSNNLVFLKSQQLLGEPVVARFGQEFPIRFDFLDTVGGGNLSLQVHPTTQFIRDSFGMQYTQDESYYLLDAYEGATVYLGLKNGIDKDEMIGDLKKAEKGELIFDADKYVNKIPAKKHDHFLIPGGTIHCSGSEALVLEISSTPNLFTFKLWDWQRLGLDGKPRPINVDRGKEVIAWERDTDYTYRYLANQAVTVAEGEGWREEHTGLHANEFIETRRHWFTQTVTHQTGNSVNVLNLVEGDEVVVESPQGSFDPFIVHYAETFIVPAGVNEYTITPSGSSIGKECATIKAYVRFKD